VFFIRLKNQPNRRYFYSISATIVLFSKGSALIWVGKTHICHPLKGITKADINKIACRLTLPSLFFFNREGEMEINVYGRE